jgi:lysophospholipase L1-like esterase
MKNNFRTSIEVNRWPFALSHNQKYLSIGSCFSEHIGEKLKASKFDILINPFGQQYNPAAIGSGLRALMSERNYQSTDLVKQDGLLHSLEHHGSFSGAEEKEVLANMNRQRALATVQLRQAHTLFVTFGTAHVFRWKATGAIVSNCHKIPASKFEQEILSPKEIVEDWTLLLQELKQFNPLLNVVATVSPVRYFAFGHYENSVSKAHLFTAIYELQKTQNDLLYFPAYELVIDDLRDYRFYNEDMLHPSAQAIDYVWQQLKMAACTPETLQLIDKITAIQQASLHRPRQPQSEQHRQFCASQLQQIAALESKYHFDFEEEKKLLSLA